MAFEPNVGQAERDVDFLARGSGYGVFLRSADAVPRARWWRAAALAPRRHSMKA